MNQTEAFWEKHYAAREAVEPGQPNVVFAGYAADLPAGRALDLGCAEGDDAIWLARRGWQVVAVDVSQTALRRAASHAEAAGVAPNIEWQQHDLARSFPAGEFDLVSAQYLHTPLAFPRARVLQRAARAVAPGGLLLIVAHASVAPWSWAAPDTVFPAPQQELDELELDLSQWEQILVGAPQRRASGPGGQTAMVTDNVIVLRRVGA